MIKVNKWKVKLVKEKKVGELSKDISKWDFIFEIPIEATLTLCVA